MNCSETNLQLEAYALDALDSLTRARVDKHLMTCAHCRAQVAELRSILGELPFALSSASSLRPPPSLKSKLLQVVDSEVHAHAQTTAIRQTFAPRAERIVPRARRGGWLLHPRVWMVSLATSLVVIVALLAWNLMSNFQMQQALSRAQRAQQQVKDIQDQQALAVPVLNSLSALELVLTPTDPTSKASGKIVMEPNKPTVVFIAYNLPRLPAAQNYVLWTIDKGVMQARGAFTPNRDGFAMVVFLAERNDPVLKQVLVTRQMSTDLVPSADRVLVWKSDPNDLSEDLSYGSLFPRPTVIHRDR